jgi:hypothetical protein
MITLLGHGAGDDTEVWIGVGLLYVIVDEPGIFHSAFVYVVIWGMYARD